MPGSWISKAGKLITRPAACMLSRLSIRDIVLIERLDIDFSPGLSVLTGETGAGKSILLDALSLALGARGDASLVRHGAAQGQVTRSSTCRATIRPARMLADNAIDDDGDIILRRVQTADGRTRVFVNDQPSSVTLMRDIGRALVEIHGQHDERALVDAGAHRDLLDAFGGHVGEARASREALAALARLRAGAGAATAPRSRRRRARRTICAPRSRSSPSSIRSPARRPSLPSARQR